MKGFRLVVFALLIGGACFAGRRVERDVAVFSFPLHPDLPLRTYAEGRLGIIQPSYARSYLYVAYRLIEGAPFSVVERNQIVDYWDWKLRGEQPERTSGSELYDRVRSAIEIPWQAPDEPNDPNTNFTLSPQFVYYQRCSDSAFRTAAEVLQSRIRRFGKDNLNTFEWVLGQDYVFENCLSAKPGYVPPPAPRDADPLIKLDREYQIAAAMFYSGRFVAAERAFRRIAANEDSPWAIVGPYLAGRAMLWRARQVGSAAPNYTDLLYAAERQFRSVIEDPSLAVTHDDARYLLLRIQVLVRQRSAGAILAGRLMSPLGASSRLQDLSLYTTLLDNSRRRRDRQRAIAESHDMGDWILTFQSETGDSLEHALERWRDSGTIAWLLAAISKVEPGHRDAAQLVAATSRASGHVAEPTLLFHAARLSAKDAPRMSRNLLERLPTMLSGLPSSRNRALALRAKLATDLDDLLFYGIAPPALLSRSAERGSYLHRWQIPEQAQKRPVPLLLEPAAQALNYAMPLSKLVELTDRGSVPRIFRTQLTGAAWVRAILLGEWEIAKTLAPLLAKVHPSLNADLDEFLSAEDRDLAFLAALTIARAPGLSPFVRSELLRTIPAHESHRGGLNWWWWPRDSTGATALPERPVVEFLSEEDGEKALSELKVLRILRDGYEWLLSQAIVAARRSSPHDRAAEMLYEALTRLDGTNLEVGLYHPSARVEELREEARTLLVEQFAESPWTARLMATRNAEPSSDSPVQP